MRFPTVVAVVLGVAVGTAAMVYGEADDSPGLQLIGVLLAAASVAFVMRALRRRHIERKRT